MQSSRGFTMLELLVAMSLVVILAAMGIPTLMESTRRNSVWSASEAIGSQIRQARLKAISRNKSFKVRFGCPTTGQFRILEVTGDTTIDNATDRCDDYQAYDSGIFALPTAVTTDISPTLTVNSRGVFSSTAGIPTTINVTYGGYTSRSLTISATGQITFGNY